MRHLPLSLTLLALCALIGLAPADAQTPPRAVFLPNVIQPLQLNLLGSYLGGPADDAVRAADFTADGRLALAGTWPDLARTSATTVTLLDGGAGALVLLNASGDTITQITRLGNNVTDMEIAADGSAVVCGSFGVLVLQPDLRSLRWSAAPGSVSRCAIGAAGTTAALVGSTVYRYAADGSSPTSWTIPGNAVNDLALDEASGLVFATGYTQKSSILKVAFLRAYRADGNLAWTAYDFAASDIVAAKLGADSAGQRVIIGDDGKLYFAGWTDGGNAIYSRDPATISRKLAGELVKFDAYNDPYSISGAKSLLWYGRFAPGNGALLLGQWALTRMSDGKGNSIGITALAAAADGTLLLAGDAYATMEDRATMRLGGVTLGGYEGGEAYLMLVSPDFRQRTLWTALTAPGTSAGGSPAQAAALSNTALAIGVTLNPRSSTPARGLYTTPTGPQPAIAGAAEGYYLIMPRP